MDCRRGILSFFKNEKKPSAFIDNGSELLEGLIASSDGQYGVPIRNFTYKELIQATKNFTDTISIGGTGEIFRGTFEQRPILVKKFFDRSFASPSHQDIVVTAQMSCLKHVLRLVGCCLELDRPILVYEDPGNGTILSDIVYNKEQVKSTQNCAQTILSWKIRLRTARDIASAIVYLHTAFPTPVIHRDLNLRNIIIDHFGVSRLVDFSLCIALPPGESQVEDSVVGTTGHAEPQYAVTGIVTEKTDVYMFGMILLVFLTGQRPFDFNRTESFRLVDYVRFHVDNDRLIDILDTVILGEGRITRDKEQQLQAFATLALRCVEDEGANRPEMINVAKQLRAIVRCLS